MKNNTVIKIGEINSSQDGVIVHWDGLAPTLTAGHGNCPKIVFIDEDFEDTTSDKTGLD